MKTKDIWTKDGSKLELVNSTYSVGNRASHCGIGHTLPRSACVKVRGAYIGINSFASREDAHAFLAKKGWIKCAA